MDATWVEHLIKEYSSGLLKYLVQHSHSREDAEDILQDVFMSVYEHCSEFDPERCNEQAWLFIIAKRKLVSYYRKSKQEESLDAMEDYEIPGDNSMAQATNLMACRQAVAIALQKLDERSRTIVIMRFFENLSSEEVAERLDLSPANVRTIQSRAMKVMERELGSFDFEE